MIVLTLVGSRYTSFFETGDKYSHPPASLALVSPNLMPDHIGHFSRTMDLVRLNLARVARHLQSLRARDQVKPLMSVASAADQTLSHDDTRSGRE